MGIQRHEIRGDTPLDIKHVNDNFTTLWYDVYGNSKYAQKIKAELDAIVGRVTDTEGNISTITQDVGSIESRVETAEGNISTVTQTANDVTLAFENQVIGGRNLLTHNLNLWELGVLVSGANAVSTTRIRTITGFVIKPDTEYIISSPLTGTAIGIHQLTASGGTFLHDSGWQTTLPYKFTSQATAGFVRITLRNEPDTGSIAPEEIGDTIKIQFEEGNKPTTWALPPEEMYAGIVKIDKDGVNVGVSTSELNTQIAYDGLRVYDGTTELASFGEAGAVTPELQADSITGNIMNTLDSNVTLNVGSGYTYSTITAALASLGRKKVLNNAAITINVYGNISDTPVVWGFTGYGLVQILLQNSATLNGSILFRDNTARCILKSAGTGKSAIRYSGTLTAPVMANNTAYLELYNLNLYGGTRGFYGYSGGKTYAQDIDVSGCANGFQLQYGHTLSTYNCIGNATTYGIYVQYGAVCFTVGTIPIGATANILASAAYHAAYGTNTATASAYSPPASTPTVFVGTFGPASLYTVNHDTSTVDTTYGATAAQGKWDGMNYWKDGVMTFGSDIYDYWRGGYNVTVEMRIRRKNSTHGTSGGVAPVPYNFSPSEAFNAVVRGAWTDWTTVPSSVFGSEGATLKFYSSVLNNGYAIFDACEVKVTVTKDV